MAAWTADELAYLQVAESMEAFQERYPDRSDAAVRSQRDRMRRQGIATAWQSAAPVLPDEVAVARERMRAQADRNLGMGEFADDEAIEVPTNEAELERLFSAYKEVRNAVNDLPGQPSKVAHWYAAEDGLPVGICFPADIHAGGNIEYELFERDLKIIRETDGLNMVSLGDTINNFKAMAKSGNGLYHDIFSQPSFQIAYITTRFRSVRDKIIAVCGGNHEGFDGVWAGIDRMPALAKDLGTVYFTEAGGSIFAHVGEHRYHIVVKHHHGGASKLNKGNRARRLWDEWPWVFDGADAVVLAHLHEPHSETVIRKGQPVEYLQCGTYKVHDEWAESRGYRPSYGVPLVIMYPDTRRIVPFHGIRFLDGVRFLEAERARYQELRQAA